MKILPASNGLGNAYHVKVKGEWKAFAYVWATRVGNEAWWKNLVLITDASEIDMLKLVERLKKGRVR